MSLYDNNATRARDEWIKNRAEEILVALQNVHDFYGKHLAALRAITFAEAELESEDADLGNAIDAHDLRSAA